MRSRWAVTARPSPGHCARCSMPATPLRGRLRTWADGMAANCWENVAYVRRMAAEDVAPREVEPAGS